MKEMPRRSRFLNATGLNSFTRVHLLNQIHHLVPQCQHVGAHRDG